jgi:hypothetical protein
MGARPLRASLERALDRLATLDVAQGDPNLRGAATHLDVVVVEDLPELAIELDGHALAQFSGADHLEVGSWVGSMARGVAVEHGRAGADGPRIGRDEALILAATMR